MCLFFDFHVPIPQVYNNFPLLATLTCYFSNSSYILWIFIFAFENPETTFKLIFGQFASAYQQTENLYHIFDRQNQEIFCFYEDHWLKNLIYSLPQKDKTFSFCDPCVLQMLHSDTKKSRQQLEILYEYLRCDRKLTNVANKLDMHRNNVIYHIKQMEEQWHLNLDDPDVRLKLLISFKVIQSLH